MQRKVFSAEFMAKVALEALVGHKTINEIARVHEVHPNQVTTWKREAQTGLKELFTRRRGRRNALAAAEQEALYGQIGRLQGQVGVVEKKSGLNPPR